MSSACLLRDRGRKHLLQHLVQAGYTRGAQTLADSKGDEAQSSTLLSLPPALVELISRRRLNIISLSPYITEGIDDALQASARNSKAIRRSGFALTERLKARSRSKNRGGLNEQTTLGSADRLKSGKKVPRWKDTAQNMRTQGLMDATDDAADRLEQDYVLPRDEVQTQGDRIEYSLAETVGYAASRLPACYAVVWRVLDELDMRTANFQPESMLDFGAGPGTAVWAASEIWEDSLKTVHAVEPSEAMRWLGVQIEQRSREAPQDEEPASEDGQLEVTAEHGLRCQEHHTNAAQSSRQNGAMVDASPLASISSPPESGAERHDSGSSDLPAEGASGNGATGAQQAERGMAGGAIRIGDRLASPKSAFGRSWGIRWLDHLQGFGDRKQLAHGRSGGRPKKRSSWVQSTGRATCLLASIALL